MDAIVTEVPESVAVAIESCSRCGGAVRSEGRRLARGAPLCDDCLEEIEAIHRGESHWTGGGFHDADAARPPP